MFVVEDLTLDSRSRVSLNLVFDLLCEFIFVIFGFGFLSI